MKSITATQEEIDKIHGRITTMYQELYKSYQKQSNKSASKAKREDAIWSTIQDLKAKDKALTLEVSMMSALE
jgi:cytochrome c556